MAANNWERVQLGPNEPFLTEVRFADKEHGWIVGRDILFRTEDGGNTWKRVLSLPPPKGSNVALRTHSPAPLVLVKLPPFLTEQPGQ
ncbi:MAG TPA: YCF48-related protein [Pyrinomonadaceae bacterium]|jgi:photosystem II stability/assembly factor-like uncharacterized protein|nr:YCF48-related protein [Pyrinomonadaceae bacterium]